MLSVSFMVNAVQFLVSQLFPSPLRPCASAGGRFFSRGDAEIAKEPKASTINNMKGRAPSAVSRRDAENAKEPTASTMKVERGTVGSRKEHEG